MKRRGFLSGLLSAPFVIFGLIRTTKAEPTLMSEEVSIQEIKMISRGMQEPAWFEDIQVCETFHLSEKEYAESSTQWKHKAKVYLRFHAQEQRKASRRGIEVTELKTKFTADISELEAAAKRAQELHSIIAN